LVQMHHPLHQDETSQPGCYSPSRLLVSAFQNQLTGEKGLLNDSFFKDKKKRPHWDAMS